MKTIKILQSIFLGLGAIFLISGIWSYSRPAPVSAANEILNTLGEEFDPYLIQIIEPSHPTQTNLPDVFQSMNDPLSIENTLEKKPNIPESLIIPSIQLKAPVQITSSRKIIVRGVEYEQWLVPDTFAVGWNPSSSSPNSGGNIVLYGHHNVNGAVFSRLYQVQTGDDVIVLSRGLEFHYKVTDIQKVKEKDISFAQMLKNGEVLKSSTEEQVTLITCWPPYDSTHRLIVIAKALP